MVGPQGQRVRFHGTGCTCPRCDRPEPRRVIDALVGELPDGTVVYSITDADPPGPA